MNTEPDIARDAGPLNLREAHAALDLHIARAMKRGDDGCAVDLQAVADVLDQFADEIETLKRSGALIRARVSYLPAMKDKQGNRIIGLMGQFDDRNEAMQKQLADFLWWIPFGLSTDGIVEYDAEVGLPNVKMEMMKYECAVISGPEFDRVLQQDKTP